MICLHTEGGWPSISDAMAEGLVGLDDSGTSRRVLRAAVCPPMPARCQVLRPRVRSLE